MSELCVKELEKIQCVVVVGQEIQGAREEEEACDVLAQGAKTPRTTSHINASAGTSDNTSDAKALMGAFGLSVIICSKLNEPNWRLLLGNAIFCIKCKHICQGHARLRNDADKLIDMVGVDSARCAQIMHPVVADAFRHSRDVSGWASDDAHARG